MFGELKERLKSMQLKLDVTEAALGVIAEQGYSEEYGARPMSRVITEQVEDRIAEGVLSGEISKGATVRVATEGSKVKVLVRN